MFQVLLRGITQFVVLIALGLGLGMALGMGEAWLNPQESVVATVELEQDKWRRGPEDRGFALERPRLEPANAVAPTNALAPSNALANEANAALPKNIDWRTIYPDTPQLRISGTQHGAEIKAIDTDRGGRFLVSASNDKTVRVWSLRDGRLLRVLRPPLGAGNVGKVYEVAISPDGARVAVGGWTGNLANNVPHRIHIFDRQTGRLLRSLEGMPGVIHSLAFSADGRWLAAGVGSRSGIRVWDLEAGSGTPTADTAYGGQVYGLAFAADGRLATSSYDGALRLYGPGRYNQPRRRVQASEGERPFRVAFSPDGGRLAVGYADRARVSLHDGHTLGALAAPPGIGNWRGTLSRVTWSGDGETLFAAGKYHRDGGRPILAWGDRGRAAPVFLRAAQNTVMGLRPFGAGGVVFGSADPALGVFRRNGSRFSEAWRVKPGSVDVRGLERDLRLSRDGAMAALRPYTGDRRWLRFNSGARQLLRVAEAPGDLASPRTSAPGLEITGWRNTRSPELNGAPITLQQYETSRSLAIAPDAQSFVLGADWTLRRFDRQGRQMWPIDVPGVAWQVNISGDGKLVVAAFGDGTVRWFRLKDGRELLALYVSTGDGNPWVAWTPKGYYDASPSGEALIGWHMNQGPDREALFSPAGTYKEVFYRPNIVASVLKLLDEDRAIAANNATLNPQQDLLATQKPVVELLSPEEGASVSGTVTVKYRLTSPSDKRITAVRVLANGQRALTIRDTELLTPGKVHSVPVTLPPGTQQISLLASTVDGYGDVESRGVVRSGIAPKAPSGGQNTLYALVIGVSDYSDIRISDLSYADDDARDVTNALKQQKGGLYKDVIIKTLVDKDATESNIEEALDWLKITPGKNDAALLYISGHGQNRDLSGPVPAGDFYFLPHDAKLDKLASTGVKEVVILDFIRSPNGRKMIFLDTCHSAGVDMNGLVARLGADENAAFVFASSTGNKVSLESAKWKNGAFTQAFLEGLGGAADFKPVDNFISHKELGLYLEDRVIELTEGAQVPASGTPRIIPSTNLVMVREETGLIASLRHRVTTWLEAW